MYFAGISDEAGVDLVTQIKANRELGWSHIELRNIDGTCITDLSDENFEKAAITLDAAGQTVIGFSAQIANWSRPIDGDFQLDVKELRRAIPRMEKMGAQFIRCMSYPNREEAPLSDEDWRDEAVRRFRELTKIAEDGGVTLIHENCSGWAGQTAEKSVEFLDRVGSEALKLVFDIGNVVSFNNVRTAVDFYKTIKERIIHVHVKDFRFNDKNEAEMCYPGEGESGLESILSDLLAGGYDGGFSIEPHMKAVIHLGKSAADDPKAAYKIYIEHGRRLMKLVDGIRSGAS